MGYIYIISNTVNNKVYIGQTIHTIEKRWKEHLYNSNHRNQILYYAMRKYGKEKFSIKILEEVSNTELDYKEREYIKKFNSISPFGYNVTTGGSKFENDNPMFHDEICTKLSKYFIGDRNPAKRPDVKEKIRQKALGRKVSDKTKLKMSKNNGRYWKGKHHSEETKQKISLNHGMRGKYGIQNPNSKSIAMIDKNTDEVIEVFDAINSAVRYLKMNFSLQHCNGSNISNVANGKQKTAYGYVWKFVK